MNNADRLAEEIAALRRRVAELETRERMRMPTALQVGAVPSTGGTFTGAVTVERLTVGTATGTATGQVKASGDVFAFDDPSGLFRRAVNQSNPVVTDHFTAFSGWTWAGAPFNGAADSVDTDLFPSFVRVGGVALAARGHFAYLTATTFATQVRLACANEPTSQTGARIDDGTDDNYVEMLLVDSATAGYRKVISRSRSGGGAVTTTDRLDLILPSFMVVLVLEKRADNTVRFRFAINAPLSSALGASLTSVTWTPQRAGFIVQRTSTGALYSYLDWIRIL
jgi:hypothetical protein